MSFGNHAGSALPLRKGKGTAWEGGQREPCVVYYPKGIKGGRTIDTPMMAIDLLPTIAEITGAELPKNKIDGKSVWDIWTGKTDQSQHEAFSSITGLMNCTAFDTKIGNSISPTPIGR